MATWERASRLFAGHAPGRRLLHLTGLAHPACLATSTVPPTPQQPTPQAPSNAVCMWGVPPALRPFAVSMSVVAIHVLGDVPSPPLLGALQGWLQNWRLRWVAGRAGCLWRGKLCHGFVAL